MAANSKQEDKKAVPTPEVTAHVAAEVTSNTVQDVSFPPSATER
jgi:hypothetical protein